MSNSPEVAEKQKWFKRGFASKAEYLGWLQFNDLVDSSMTFDDTYYDQYSGKVIKLSDNDHKDTEKDDADIFLEQISKPQSEGVKW